MIIPRLEPENILVSFQLTATAETYDCTELLAELLKDYVNDIVQEATIRTETSKIEHYFGYRPSQNTHVALLMNLDFSLTKSSG